MDVQGWFGFLSVAAGIAATLSGLVFLAVSINLNHVVGKAGVASLALESLTQLLGAMTIGVVCIAPGEGAAAVGTQLIALTCVLWAFQTRWQLAFLRQNASRPWRWAASRIFRTQVSCVPFFVAGILLCGRHLSGMYWLVPGMVLSFIAGVTNAWVLLVTIVSVNRYETPSLGTPEAGRS